MNKPLAVQGSLLARNTLLNLLGQAVPLLAFFVLSWGRSCTALDPAPAHGVGSRHRGGA